MSASEQGMYFGINTPAKDICIFNSSSLPYRASRDPIRISLILINIYPTFGKYKECLNNGNIPFLLKSGISQYTTQKTFENIIGSLFGALYRPRFLMGWKKSERRLRVSKITLFSIRHKQIKFPLQLKNIIP